MLNNFQLKEVNDQMEEEKRKHFELTSQKSASESTNVRKVWSELETQILIKAVNLFPAGTQDRFVIYANIYI